MDSIISGRTSDIDFTDWKTVEGIKTRMRVVENADGKFDVLNDTIDLSDGFSCSTPMFTFTGESDAVNKMNEIH